MKKSQGFPSLNTYFYQSLWLCNFRLNVQKKALKITLPNSERIFKVKKIYLIEANNGRHRRNSLNQLLQPYV